MPLTATTTPEDQDRMARLLIAWTEGDRLAMDYVLEQVMDDPVGVPGLLFTMCTFTTRLGAQSCPDFIERLRAKLLDGQDSGGDGRGSE